MSIYQLINMLLSRCVDMTTRLMQPSENNKNEEVSCLAGCPRTATILPVERISDGRIPVLLAPDPVAQQMANNESSGTTASTGRSLDGTAHFM